MGSIVELQTHVSQEFLDGTLSPACEETRTGERTSQDKTNLPWWCHRHRVEYKNTVKLDVVVRKMRRSKVTFAVHTQILHSSIFSLNKLKSPNNPILKDRVLQVTA